MHCMAALSGSITLAVAVLVLAEVYTLVAGITLPDTDRLSTGGGTQPDTEQDTDTLVEEGWDATFSWILSGSPERKVNKNNNCLLHDHEQKVQTESNIFIFKLNNFDQTNWFLFF